MPRVRHPLAPDPTILSQREVTVIVPQSPWDELTRNHFKLQGHDPQRVRCDFFETAIRSNGTNWQDVSLELHRRREWWRNEFTSPHDRRRVRNAVDVALLGCFIVASFVLLRMVLSNPLAAFLALPISAVATLMMTAYRCRLAGRLVRAIRMPQCPACAYDVSALSAIPPERIDGQISGPDRCPECGTPWPLIPPPCPR